jgi:hypothetical protein
LQRREALESNFKLQWGRPSGRVFQHLYVCDAYAAHLMVLALDVVYAAGGQKDNGKEGREK